MGGLRTFVAGSVLRVGAGLLGATALAATSPGCGASPPREQDVYHEASLRPGSVLPETEAERQLLERMSTFAPGTAVVIADHTFVLLAPYDSASGRRCVPVRETRTGRDLHRVACEDGGTWTFVPDVFDGDDPFAAAPAASEGTAAEGRP